MRDILEFTCCVCKQTFVRLVDDEYDPPDAYVSSLCESCGEYAIELFGQEGEKV